MVLLLAFYFIGTSERAPAWYILATGTLTGAAVCGMHYVGQLGISNFSCSYKLAHVIGAAVIAVSASITALGVFFRLRASWTNSWWKRVVCASILAVAVSGMHWTAELGTRYRGRGSFLSGAGQLSSSQTVIVCTTLSCASCLFLIGLAILTNRQHRRSANRVKQLVLATAFFDPQGRVMVSPEGLLPSQKITNQYIERSFADDEFCRTHPAFIWALRASHSWGVLRKLIPGMKYHLLSDDSTKKYYVEDLSTEENGTEMDMDFKFIFKELFCVAALELAEHIHQPLEKLGALYDNILVTGTKTPKSNAQKSQLDIKQQDGGDLETLAAPDMIGKGQFLFTVRQLSKEESANLAAIGYRFAILPQISLTLARSMQVSHDEMQRYLEDLRQYSYPKTMMDPGIYLTCFSLHPSVRKGFDVLACKDAPNLLPHIPLPIRNLTSLQLDILERMNDWSLNFCLRWLKGHGGFTDLESKQFCEQMYNAVAQLVDVVEVPAFGLAKFSSRRIMIPCKPVAQTGTGTGTATGTATATAKCTIFTFRLINGLQNRVTSHRLCLTPLRLFSAQQQVYPGIVDHETFRQGLLEEFAHCASQAHGSKNGSSTSSFMGSSPPSSHASHLRPSRKGSKLSKSASINEEAKIKPVPAFGGIMVSNQVTVDVVECSGEETFNNNNYEMRDLGVTAEATYAGPGYETFVDELCAICRDIPDADVHSY
ncbi:hypothetical protein FQN57_006251 [Myotisia sp. PD_48]|nr:hypothetical protein FQN57_006251 [Myotisia sp. PD_48]